MLKANTSLHPGILEIEVKGDRTETQVINNCKEGYKAMIFLMNADARIYGKLWKCLSESVTLGINQYPRTITAAFEILSKCKLEINRIHQSQPSTKTNMPYAKDRPA